MPSLITLMKSNTTRRSQPMIRSRLRRPTSKSMTTVLCPRSARPAANAAAVVVLPTPPLPEVMTITFAKGRSSRPCVGPAEAGSPEPLVEGCYFPAAAGRSATLSLGRDQASISRDGQPIIDERDLHRRAQLFRRQLLADQ